MFEVHENEISLRKRSYGGDAQVRASEATLNRTMVRFGKIRWFRSINTRGLLALRGDFLFFLCCKTLF